jgi:hypothetical protein
VSVSTRALLLTGSFRNPCSLRMDTDPAQNGPSPTSTPCPPNSEQARGTPSVSSDRRGSASAAAPTVLTFLHLDGRGFDGTNHAPPVFRLVFQTRTSQGAAQTLHTHMVERKQIHQTLFEMVAYDIEGVDGWWTCILAILL